MMDLEQALLGHLQEECNEIAQIASKAQRFGLAEVWQDDKRNPLKLSNRDRLHIEINDLYAIIELLQQHLRHEEFGMPHADLIALKQKKIAKYLIYSAKLGKVK